MKVRSAYLRHFLSPSKEIAILSFLEDHFTQEIQCWRSRGYYAQSTFLMILSQWLWTNPFVCKRESRINFYRAQNAMYSAVTLFVFCSLSHTYKESLRSHPGLPGRPMGLVVCETTFHFNYLHGPILSIKLFSKQILWCSTVHYLFPKKITLPCIIGSAWRLKVGFSRFISRYCITLA